MVHQKNCRPTLTENNNLQQQSVTAARNKRPLVFLVVGIVNTLLDFSFYTLLTQTIFKHSSQIALAGLVSGTFSLFCAFLTHSFITWRGTSISHKTLLKFVAATGFGMWVVRPLLLKVFITFTALYSWAHQILQSIGLNFSQQFVASTGAFGFMIIIVLAYNYIVYDRFVFSEK